MLREPSEYQLFVDVPNKFVHHKIHALEQHKSILNEFFPQVMSKKL